MAEDLAMKLSELLSSETPTPPPTRQTKMRMLMKIMTEAVAVAIEAREYAPRSSNELHGSTNNPDGGGTATDRSCYRNLV